MQAVSNVSLAACAFAPCFVTNPTHNNVKNSPYSNNNDSNSLCCARFLNTTDITVASVRTAGREIIANFKSIRIIRRHQSWSKKSATSFPDIKLFGLLYSQSWAFLRSFTFEDIISLNSEEKDPTDVIAVEKIRKWLLLVMTHEILFRSECWTKRIGEK